MAQEETGTPRIITLISDYGMDNLYAAALKGAIIQRDPGIRIVDITHGIRPYDTNQAAFALRASIPHFPKGTVHLIALNTNTTEDYVHRIGRTGRAGRTGQSFTFIADSDDEKLLLAIEQLISISIPEHTTTFNYTNLSKKNNSHSKGSRNKSISKIAEKHEQTVLKESQKPIKTRRSSEKRPPDWIGGNGL